MADYWKSNARKFCEVCKCWFADNKISVENHERGLRHKGAVQARLRELSRKAVEQDKKDAALAATLAQMEQAAVMSMKADVKVADPSLAATGGCAAKTRAPTAYEEAKAKVRAERDRIKELKRTAKRSTLLDVEEPEEQTYSNSAQTTEKSSSDIQWVRTNDDKGNTYFFNIYSGDTRWDAPEHFYSMEEYQTYYSQFVQSTSLEGTGYDAYTNADLSQQFYSSEPPPAPPAEEEPFRPEGEEDDVQDDKEAVIVPTRLSKVPADEPELKRAKQELHDEDQEPSSSSPPRSRGGGLLGSWVPVVERKPEAKISEMKENPKVVLDDLPEEAGQVKEAQPTFDDVEVAGVTFEENKLPLQASGKKPKVIEFKKRRTAAARSARVREDD